MVNPRDYRSTEMGGAANLVLNLPASLKRELEKAAREDGTSLNQFIVTAAAEKLSALRTAEFFEERRKRADVPKALEIMSRARGGEPMPGDEL